MSKVGRMYREADMYELGQLKFQRSVDDVIVVHGAFILDLWEHQPAHIHKKTSENFLELHLMFDFISLAASCIFSVFHI